MFGVMTKTSVSSGKKVPLLPFTTKKKNLLDPIDQSVNAKVHWCNFTVKKPIFFLQCEILVYKLLKQNSNKKEPENQDLEVKAELLKVHLQKRKEWAQWAFSS